MGAISLLFGVLVLFLAFLWLQAAHGVKQPVAGFIVFLFLGLIGAGYVFSSLSMIG